MRALTWLVGVLVILLGLNAGASRSSGWAAVWVASAALWFFVGVGLSVTYLAKLVAGKVGAVGTATRAGRPGPSTAPKTDEPQR